MKLDIQKFADGYVTIKTELDTKGFDRQIAQLEFELEELEETYKLALKDPKWNKKDLIEMQSQIEKTKNKIVQLRQQQAGLNQETSTHGFTLDNTIRKIGRWGLALFGVRSAYMFVRQAASSLSSTNKQIGTDIEYMKWALAQMLEKVVIRIIQWAYKLLQIINYVVYGVTGINLFANASAKAFERQHVAMSGTAKSAKQLQKTLAGFDEMNILQKNGDTSAGGGGGGGGISLPSEDLSKFGEISGKLKKILDKIIEKVKPIWDWVKKTVDKLGGLKNVILGIIGLKLIKKIGELLGVSGGAGGAGASGLLGVLSVLTLLVADVWLIKVAWEGVKEVDAEAKNLNKRVQNLKENIVESTKSWKDNSKELVNNVKAGKTTTEQNERIANGLLKNIHNTEVLIDDLEKQKYSGSLVVDMWNSFRGTTAKAQESINALNEEQKNDIELLIEMYNAGKLNEKQKKALIPYFEKEIKKYEELKDMHSKGSSKAKEYQEKIDALKQSLKDIKGNYDAKIKLYADDKNARKTISNLLVDIGSAGIQGAVGIKTSIEEAIRKIKYAKGGIINMPGRGVPIAYGGERGAEGVVPLTDSQQMALLGEAIGKYVTINANITNNMNGRVISRELQKIQQENSFASNR